MLSIRGICSPKASKANQFQQRGCADQNTYSVLGGCSESAAVGDGDAHAHASVAAICQDRAEGPHQLMPLYTIPLSASRLFLPLCPPQKDTSHTHNSRPPTGKITRTDTNTRTHMWAAFPVQKCRRHTFLYWTQRCAFQYKNVYSPYIFVP